MTTKKVAAKTEWTVGRERSYVDASVFGEPSKTYITGLDLSRDYATIERWEPAEGEFNEVHITSPRKGAAPQAIFIDYVMLKGVENMTIDYRPGEPMRLHLDMIIGKVTHVDDDPSKD